LTQIKQSDGFLLFYEMETAGRTAFAADGRALTFAGWLLPRRERGNIE
jgi:hypothetical protein